MPIIRDVSGSTSTPIDPSRDVGAADGSKAPGKKVKDVKDVFVKDGALIFAPTAQPTKADKLAYAKKLLATLRATSEIKLSFGGRVATGGIDPAASLRAYYPSLKTARELGEASPDFLAAIDHFLTDVSVPNDLQALLRSAANVAPPFDAEPAAPLGAEADTNRQNYVNATQNAGNPAKLAVTDDVLRNVIMANNGSNWCQDLCGWISGRTPEIMLAQVRLYARARELGIGIQVSNWQNLGRAIPNTPEAAKALWRLAKAFNVDPAQVTFHTQTLATYIEAQKKAPAGTTSRSVASSSGPLGTVGFTDKNTTLTALQQCNVAVTQVDDATVLRMFTTFGWGKGVEGWANYFKGTPQFNVGWLRVLTRAKELGQPMTVDVGSLQGAIVPKLGADDESAAALRRFAAAFGVAESQLMLGGRRLDQWAPSAGAARRATLRRARPGRGGPLGAVVINNQNEASQKLNTRQDVSLFQCDDASVRRLFGPSGWWISSPDVSSWYSHVQSGQTPEFKRGMLQLLTRAKELGCAMTCNVTGTQQHIVRYLPADEASAAVLRRLCAAFGLSETSFTLGNQRLDQWPRRSAGGHDPLATAKLGNRNFMSQGIQERVTAKDVTVFEMTDPSIELFKNLYTTPYNVAGQSEERAWQVGVLKLWERGLELGLFDAQYLPHYTSQQLKPALHNDAEVMELVARIARRGGLAPNQMGMVGGTNLANHAPYTDALAKLNLRVEGESAAIPARRVDNAVLVQPAPLGTLEDPYTPFWNARDPRFFQLSDNALRTQLSGAGDIPHWLNQMQSPRVFLVQARLAELGIVKAQQNIQTYLRSVVPAQYAADEAIPMIVRMANAASVSLDTVNLQQANGQPLNIKLHPAYQALVAAQATPDADKALRKSLKVLDPAGSASAEEKRAALVRLLGDEEPKFNFGELLAAGVEGRLGGKVAPVTVNRLGADKLTELATQSVGRWDHLGALAVLGGLYTALPKETLRDLIVAKGFSAEQAETWSNVAVALQGLDGPALRFALASVADPKSEPDFWRLQLGATLAADQTLATETLTKLFERFGQDDPVGFVSALLERALLAGTGGALQKRITDFVDAKVGAGELSADDVKEALTPDAIKLVAPQAEAAINDAVTATIKAKPEDKAEAIAKLVATVQASAVYVDATTLAEKALSQLYQADLARVVPLKQADEELGGVAAERFDAAAKKLDGPLVTVAGLEIQANDRADKDTRMVPREAQARLIMTPTTERNLKLLAAAWRLKRPVLLEGPTSSGKTSAVRYIACKAGAPYRRINLSYYTDVSDLLGRYVGGEKRYKDVDLAAMSDARLKAIALDYQLDELLGEQAFARLTKQGLVKEILDVQLKPRWVDGPVIKAMKRGEVLLLDEINLARPEVIERLNSLFDDDGNLVLTEHRNEVIKPDKNFRVFATMNPASYAGRTRLSEAMRSRWNNVYAHGLTQSDITQIVKTIYGAKIPEVELAKLVAVHDNLARMADEGAIGRKGGGVAFTLRNLFRVAERFIKFQGGGLGDDALMRREVEEVYYGGLFEAEDQQAVKDILHTAMPYSGPSFYANLEFKEDADSFTIGDVQVRKMDTGHNLVPPEASRLVLTDRTKQVLYRLAKALEMGENVAMMGVRACGKTAIAKMYAMLRGQPYYRQLFSAGTDGMQLIGGYDDQGWKDGLLLNAGRPDGTPGLFLGDELNFGNPALLERLNSVLDDERKLVLNEKEGEEIRLHPEFRFVAAMNPPTKGYGGREKLSKAMQNRFTMINVPDIDTREEILEIGKVVGGKMGVPEAIVETLTDLHLWITKSYETATLGKELREADRPVYSIRQVLGALKMVSEFSAELGEAQAYLFAVQAYYASISEQADSEAILKKAEEMAK